jgi:hypothetical protein
MPEKRPVPHSSPCSSVNYLYGPIASHFRPRRHLLPASVYRQEMAHRSQIWWEIMGTVMAA